MFDINKCYDYFATEPNSAYFWSGLGENGQDIAAQVAQKNGGTTLEMLMGKNKDELISAGFPYDEDLGGFYFSKENAQDWQDISRAYAEQASGDVHAVLGDDVRENSVWNTKELPALEKNENVNRVISTDPSTGKEKDVLLEKSSKAGSSEVSGKINSQAVVSEKGGGARAPNTTKRGNTNNPPENKKASTKRDQLPPQEFNAASAQNSKVRGQLPEGEDKSKAFNVTEIDVTGGAQKAAQQTSKTLSSAAGMGV